MRRALELLIRFTSGGLLVLFAFVPAWILGHLARSAIQEPHTLDGAAALALVVCSALLCFLGLLAYRAFTGRGRASDGGLLPPLALSAIAIAFGCMAILIVAFGLHRSDWAAIIGGAVYLAGAIMLFRLVQRRRRGEEESDAADAADRSEEPDDRE